MEQRTVDKINAILTCGNGCSVLRYSSTICYFMVGLISSTPRTLVYYFTCKGNDRGWDGWMASPTQWTWVWVNSRSWWWTGRPGVLRFIRSQRVGHDWATELNWPNPRCNNNNYKHMFYSSILFNIRLPSHINYYFLIMQIIYQYIVVAKIKPHR